MNDDIAKFLNDSAYWLWERRKEGGCCHYPLTDRLQLSVGWTQDGGEGEWSDEDFSIAAAITGFNPKSILDTDLDWMTMPYDPDTGDVWNTKTTLHPDMDFEWYAEWFAKQSEEITKNLEMGLIKEI